MTASTNPKRFYAAATVADREYGSFGIELDGRPVKTPAGRALAVPSRALWPTPSPKNGTPKGIKSCPPASRSRVLRIAQSMALRSGKGR